MLLTTAKARFSRAVIKITSPGLVLPPAARGEDEPVAQGRAGRGGLRGAQQVTGWPAHLPLEDTRNLLPPLQLFDEHLGATFLGK